MSSLFSGFPSQQQETFYNSLLNKAMQMMTDRLISLMTMDRMEHGGIGGLNDSSLDITTLNEK